MDLWDNLWIRNPLPMSGQPKMEDGCCHKTVTQRCSDCSFRTTPKEPIDKDKKE